MNPYQVMGLIVCGTLAFAAVVAIITMQGVHVLHAFGGVYIVAVFCMLSMQRRARTQFENKENLRIRYDDRDTLGYQQRAHR